MTETSIAMQDAGAAVTHERLGRRPGALAGIAMFAVLVVLAGVVLVPILATALNGFKELGDLQSRPFSLPRVWVWQNYWDILTGFLNDRGEAQGRPVGVRLDKQGALLVADDVGNTVWRVTPASAVPAAR